MSEDSRAIRPPEHLAAQHDLSEFSTGGHSTLDAWLRMRSRAAEGLTARTYVACSQSRPETVVAYHCVLAAMEQRQMLPNARLRKGTPEQIPLLLIGRLAVDRAWQGRGVGSAMLVDAIRRCVAASDVIGARGIVAQAIDQPAAEFYQRHGFLLSPLGERVLVMPIESAKRLVAER
jgi:GNAT superfamily N-acetyltransferase